MPRPLVLLLGAVALVGAAWALFVPPWQAPDENAHFAYAQSVSERFDLPGDERRPIFSSEQQLAVDRSNSDQAAATIETKPEWSREAFERWKLADGQLSDGDREDGGGRNPASTNPPLYYLYESPAYLAASGGDIFDRLYAMRLWSVLLLLVTTTATWLLAGELFGPNRPLQLTAAAVAGLQPMVSFVSASVNPDALLFALWSLALWLGARILKRGLDVRSGVALFAVVGLGVTVKATGYALLPAALLVLIVGAIRRRRAGGGAAAIVVAALLAFAVPTGAWLASAAALDRPAVNEIETSDQRPTPTITSFNPRELGSYLWQFYLPRLPFQQKTRGLSDLPVYDTWVKTGWAAFGWLEVRFPNPVYLLLAALSALALVAATIALLRMRRAIDPAILAFFAIAILTLLAGLHWTEFRTLTGSFRPFNQGRYLLPLIPLGGAACAAALTLLPAGRRMTGAAILVAGLFTLELFSLAIVGGRFYA